MKEFFKSERVEVIAIPCIIAVSSFVIAAAALTFLLSLSNNIGA